MTQNTDYPSPMSIFFSNVPLYVAQLVVMELKNLHEHLKNEIKTANTTYQKFTISNLTQCQVGQ